MAVFVLGEFTSPATMLKAAERLHELGHRDIDGYTPYALEGAEEIFRLPRSRVPLFVLVGGLVGAAFGYLMMYWCNVIDYPINVGGRTLHSYPAFIPITFELGILFASLSSFGAFLGFTGLPKLYHPVFEHEEFRRASIDTFWISIRLEADADRGPVTEELGRLSARNVKSVEAK